MTDLMEPNVNFRESMCDVPSNLDHDLIKRIAKQHETIKPAEQVKIPLIFGRRSAKAVQKAAQNLDVIMPGWASKVNLDTLNLRSLTNCILGQVFGRYHIGMQIYASSVYNSNTESVLNRAVFAYDSPYIINAWHREVQART